MKQYNSFTEIDKQLKILHLQREIDLEGFKLNVNRFKSDLYPSQLLGGLKGMVQKTLISYVLQRFLAYRKAKQIEQ
ncbi:hypothetical protein HPE56_09155 [Maribacter sp. ANRC-HE7]|uniref:50S ribosomal protein L29 n=1 Tax=Maribacter aquimaris TaxID=2737171 RepID=A0ABR7V2N4_9FLAO|nr:DUF6327 family protein [Maribacter aquimaris]MBD0777961.1 hypothetical protein [Maribacter aquimaris]